jgi:hypothetical protein
MAMALCIELVQYSQTVSSTYPQIFSNLAALHEAPTDKSLESKILDDLKGCNSSIDRNRKLAQFVTDGLRDFEQTLQAETPVIQDTKRILIFDNDALMKLDFPSPHAILFINTFRSNVAKMQGFFNIKFPDRPFPEDLIPSIQEMIGTWTAIGSDLASIESYLDASKLESLAKIVLGLNKKIILRKWETLANEGQGWVNDRLSDVQREILEDLTDIPTLQALEQNVLSDRNFYLTSANQ